MTHVFFESLLLITRTLLVAVKDHFRGIAISRKLGWERSLLRSGGDTVQTNAESGVFIDVNFRNTGGRSRCGIMSGMTFVTPGGAWRKAGGLHALRLMSAAAERRAPAPTHCHVQSIPVQDTEVTHSRVPNSQQHRQGN